MSDEILLRPHQVRTVQMVHDQIRAGHKRICCVAPTGFGKRICAVWWSQKTVAQGKSALIVTDRRILVKQMKDDMQKFGVWYGIIMGDSPEQREAPVQVASIHTLQSRGWLENGDGLPPSDIVLIDERHKSLDAYLQLQDRYRGVIEIGLTATPVDGQGRTLEGTHCDVVVEGCKNSELVKGGWLLPTTVICPSEPNIEGVKINGGEEFNQNQLSKAVRSVTAFGNVFDEWAPFANRKTIVFAPGVAYCRGLAEGPGDSFKARGIHAEVIEAKTKTQDRERIFEEFNDPDSDLKVLLSVDVLKEGFDSSIASCAIDLQPNSQLRTYWQKLGRIKRAHEGQTEAIYIDMAGNLWRHYMHPDDDPNWGEVKGDTTTADLTIRKKTDPSEPKQIVCPKCGQSRQGGAICPNCKHECTKQVKHIRMGNGKLKEVSAEYVAKREKSEQEKLASKWKSALYVGNKMGRTLAQCGFMFKKDHGVNPPNTFPCVPEFGSAQWKRKVGDVYSPQDVAIQFSKWEAKVKQQSQTQTDFKDW